MRPSLRDAGSNGLIREEADVPVVPHCVCLCRSEQPTIPLLPSFVCLISTRVLRAETPDVHGVNPMIPHSYNAMIGAAPSQVLIGNVTSRLFVSLSSGNVTSRHGEKNDQLKVGRGG